MKTQIAESILALVLPPDRAAAAVGDWMEESRERGSFWFWSCVIRTVFARIWSDLTGSPVTMVRIGLWGFARNFVVAAGFYGLFMFLLDGPWRPPYADIRYRHDWIWNTLMVNYAKNPAPPQLSLRWQIELICWLIYSARLVQTARWVVRCLRGREMAGGASVALAGWITIILLLRYTSLMVTPWSFLMYSAHDLILFAAIIVMRHRTLIPGTVG